MCIRDRYTPVQLTEEKHDENVAEVEDLFGNLLMDDEPEVKKTFNDCLLYTSTGFRSAIR